MFNKLRVVAVALPLALVACQQPTGTPLPVITVPPIHMPVEVQQACQVLSWAVPVLDAMGYLPANLQPYVAAARPALASCSAGNATQAVVDLAVALQGYLTSRGVHAPVGVPIIRR